MTSGRPIEIIGGGLAGLSLGLGLQRRGVTTTVVEAGDYPRHRVCGEFIAGLDRATLDALGLAPVLADAPRWWETAWFVPGRAPLIQRLPAPALAISRWALDARLAAAYRAAGGSLRTGTRVTELAPAPGRVFALGRQRAKSDWVGLKVHLTSGFALRHGLEVYLGTDAYVGLSRVETGAVNVCGLFRRPARLRVPDPGSERGTRADRGPETWRQFLLEAGLDELAHRLADARPEPGSFCAVAALTFATPSEHHDDRIVLGDAWAMIPPYTGHGMAMAFQSAAGAVAPLERYARGELPWRDACRAVARGRRARFRIRMASANALHPFLLRPHRQRWLVTLSRARALPFRALYAVLHGGRNPESAAASLLPRPASPPPRLTA